MDDLTTTAGDAAVRIQSLVVSFGDRPILKDIELDVPARSLTVILGRSGSGKTTLLRALNRLNECFPQCKTEGSVHLRLGSAWIGIYGKMGGPGGIPADELRSRVGMVFQSPNVLPMSIERNMALPLELVAGLSKSEIRDRMEHALREALLWDEVQDRLRESALRLSGGQQQRLCLARALALRPEYLLLDEPTSSLDYVAAARVEELLLRLREHYTLIMVSHSLGQARRLADKAVMLREGRVARILKRRELLEPGTLEACIEDIL